MNKFQWIITQLNATIRDYATRNEEYRRIQEWIKQGGAGKPSAPPAAATPTITFGSFTPALTISSATVAGTGPSVSPIQSAAEGATPVVGAVAAPATAEATDDQPGMVASLLYGAATFMLPAHMALKASKATSANTFIKSLEAMLDELPGAYEESDVRTKLSRFLSLVDKEIKLIETYRSEYRADESSMPTPKDKGELDALLDVYKAVIEWLLKPENLEIFCISLKADECKQVTDSRKGERRTVYTEPIPLTKDLIANLMERILEIVLDQSRAAKYRTADAVIIKYSPSVPENAVPDLLYHLSQAIRSVNRFNSMFTVCQNEAMTSLKASDRLTDSPDRLQNTVDVLSNLCYRVECIRKQSESTFSFGNPFLAKLEADVKKWSLDADGKLRERVKTSLSHDVAAPARAAPPI